MTAGTLASMADTIAVMNAGRIEQLGSPAEIYELPRTVFVANFLGQSNLIAGERTGVLGDIVEVTAHGQVFGIPASRTSAPGVSVFVGVRPEKMTVVDLADEHAPDPHEQERILLRELGEYQPDLLERPRVVVGTKADSAVHAWDSQSISSITNQGVRDLVAKLSELVHQARQQQPEHEGIVIIRPEQEGARVERLGEHEYRLIGRQVERIVALNDVGYAGPLSVEWEDSRMDRVHGAAEAASSPAGSSSRRSGGRTTTGTHAPSTST